MKKISKEIQSKAMRLFRDEGISISSFVGIRSNPKSNRELIYGISSDGGLKSVALTD